MIILLDLNYTLVENSHVKASPFSNQIELETYRQWLIDEIKKHTVVLITARPKKYEATTLDSIKSKTGWLPTAAFFNDLDMQPPKIKESILQRFVFPQYGKDPAQYLALESNPRTRAMYATYQIHAIPVEHPTCRDLLTK